MQQALKRPKFISSLIFFSIVLLTVLACIEIIPKNQFKDLLYFNYALFVILSVEMSLNSLLYPFYSLSFFTLFPVAFFIAISFAFKPKPKIWTKEMFGISLSPMACPISIIALQAYLSANNNNELLVYTEGTWPYQLLHTILIACISACTAIWAHFNLTSTDKELKWFVFWIELSLTVICLQYYAVALNSKMPAAHW